MNGAEALLQTLLAAGIEVCFTNPGTSEMHFVAALDGEPRMRSVLALFEGVVTGAADGYGRMAGKPACTLLHLGPGLANGLANLHNARRAHTPIVNVVGEHASYHRALDAPLTSDIEGFAGPVSSWIRTSPTAADVAGDAAAAVQAATAPPGQIATLILPADTAWTDCAGPVEPLPAKPPDPCQTDIDALARALRQDGPRTCFLIGSAGASEANLALLGRIAAATGARLLGDTFMARVPRGAGRILLDRLPYFAEQAEAALAGIAHLVLVDTKAPVSFFAYPGRASELTPAGVAVHQLSLPGDDTAGALQALADALGAAATAPALATRAPPGRPRGALSVESVAAAIGHLLPEQAIVVNEAATSGFAIPAMTHQSAPHDWLDLTGGAIGMGIPAAIGAALACPDRRVVALQADGSGMYTVQGLWTQAREGLDITTVIFANRKYAILQVELMRLGFTNPGPRAFDMLDLSRPDLDWVALARGMGVPGERVDSADALCVALERSLATPGPYLIEVPL